MEANKAPYKIYCTTTYLSNKGGRTVWKKHPVAGAENIEYVRTDVIIKKAKEFLSKESNIPLWEGYNGDFGCDVSKLVENFINYMER